jgi:hypothetical protein
MPVKARMMFSVRAEICSLSAGDEKRMESGGAAASDAAGARIRSRMGSSIRGGEELQVRRTNGIKSAGDFAARLHLKGALTPPPPLPPLPPQWQQALLDDSAATSQNLKDVPFILVFSSAEGM